jgi:co-chaperonin GroES (HSP10)
MIMEKLTPEQEAVLDKLDSEVGVPIIGKGLPIIGDAKPWKVKALGKWVVAVVGKSPEKTEGGLHLPEKGETEGYMFVASIGDEVEKVKVGDNILAPAAHFQKDKNTGQIWALMSEDLIVGVLEEA